MRLSLPPSPLPAVPRGAGEEAREQAPQAEGEGAIRPAEAVATTGRTVRLFVALWPDASLRGRLAGAASAWNWPKGVALMRPTTLHLTLHFLGAVPVERLPELQAALAVHFKPFVLCLDELRVWHRGIAVVQASALPPELRELHRSLGVALERLGLAVDTRPLRPHVTLARHAAHAVPLDNDLTIRWQVRDYALVASVRQGEEGDGQPVEQTYRIVQRYGPRGRRLSAPATGLGAMPAAPIGS